MDGLIVYGSKYGTTRRYAEELSRLTGLPAIPCGEFHRLAEGSILVYLGALYAGGVLGLKQAMKGLSLGDGQRLIVATGLEMSRNVQSGNTQNLKSMVIQRSFPKWSVAERRKTAAASDQAAVCACAHSRYFTGGSPSGLRV